MLRFKILLFLLFLVLDLAAQVNTSNISIVRDKWGVPHVYAKTDKEAAYGLAWAHAEDDFKTFDKGMPQGLSKSDKAELYNTLRGSMQVESFDDFAGFFAAFLRVVLRGDLLSSAASLLVTLAESTTSSAGSPLVCDGADWPVSSRSFSAASFLATRRPRLRPRAAFFGLASSSPAVAVASSIGSPV